MEESRNGLLAAKDAGMRCLITRSGYTQHEDFAMADLVVDELGDEPGRCIRLKQLQAVLHCPMKLFLDTADVAAIRRVRGTGLLDGVTTNPSHVAKAGRVFEDVLEEICAESPEHVSVEAVAENTEGLVAEARRLAAFGKQVVVKIPMTRDGLRAVPLLERRYRIRTNVTMVFSPTQALLAMKAGASFVSIVLSRLEAVAIESDRLIHDTMAVKREYEFNSEIIAGSLKTQPTLLECLRAGVDIATFPEELFNLLFQHPLTELGLAQFNRDWAQVKKRG